MLLLVAFYATLCEHDVFELYYFACLSLLLAYGAKAISARFYLLRLKSCLNRNQSGWLLYFSVATKRVLRAECRVPSGGCCGVASSNRLSVTKLLSGNITADWHFFVVECGVLVTMHTFKETYLYIYMCVCVRLWSILYSFSWFMLYMEIRLLEKCKGCELQKKKENKNT